MSDARSRILARLRIVQRLAGQLLANRLLDGAPRYRGEVVGRPCAQALVLSPAAWDHFQTDPRPRIADTLHHIHLVQHVQHIFLQAWRGSAFAVRERSEFASLDDIAAWGLDGRRGVLSFVEGSTADELARECRMPWAAHYEQQSKQTAAAHTLAESILQVFLHTQHHRGQVCERLRETGGVPPTIDFIVWLWSGRPAEALRG